jgi:hypothetical protein
MLEMTKWALSIHLSKQFDNNNVIMLLWKKISKDDLVLTCGVAFLEIWIYWISLYSFETFETMFIWPHQVPKKIVRVCQEKTRNFLLNAKADISTRYR